MQIEKFSLRIDRLILKNFQRSYSTKLSVSRLDNIQLRILYKVRFVRVCSVPLFRHREVQEMMP